MTAMAKQPGICAVAERIRIADAENAGAEHGDLSVRQGKQAIQQVRVGSVRLAIDQTEFLCQPGETTAARGQPVSDLPDHAGEGEGGKILAQ